jgi:hypothetical protein
MKIRLCHCLALLLLLGSNLMLAQIPWKSPLDRAGRSHTPQSSQKVAEHEDYPERYIDLTWNNSLNQWDSTYRASFTYNPNGKVVESIYEYYNVNYFEPFSKTIYRYNALGQNDTTYYYSWNGSWDYQDRRDMDFDAQGNPTLVMGYSWNVSQWDSAWGYRTTYNYVFGNRISYQLDEDWNAGIGWENWALTTAHFPDPSGWDSLAFAYWDMGGDWVWTERFVDATWHDFSKSIMLSGTLQQYDSITWANVLRFECTVSQYDSQLYLFDKWNGVSWDDSTDKIVRLMDSLDHMVVDDYYVRTTNWEVTDGYHYQYTYDTQGHTMEWVEEVFNLPNYEPNYKRMFFDFFTKRDDPQFPLPSFTAYPNPCADRLNFTWEKQGAAGPVEIKLLDLHGRMRMQTVAPAAGEEVSLPISEQLENGIYVYQVRTRAGVATGKVVVQR